MLWEFNSILMLSNGEIDACVCEEDQMRYLALVTGMTTHILC